jgi:hypothetical protein
VSATGDDETGTSVENPANFSYIYLTDSRLANDVAAKARRLMMEFIRTRAALKEMSKDIFAH